MSQEELKGTADIKMVILTEETMEKLKNMRNKANKKAAKKLRQQGQELYVEILASMIGRGGVSVPLRAVVVSLDDEMLSVKQNMVRPAKQIITEAEKMGNLDPILPNFLANVIQGESLYQYSVGEFFELYGRFEGRYGEGFDKAGAKMEELLKGEKGDEGYFKDYIYKGKPERVPLPYAVRSILAHQGNNPNSLDPEGKELKAAIDLLRKWVG